MVLRVYNTLTRENEDFVPLNGKIVNMYVCGPTVYDHCHLGHARSYVSFDVIRRYLIYRGYDVNYVSNITDVDDKVIDRAKESGEDAFELSRKFTASFEEDMKALGVMEPDTRPKVTEHIEDIIDTVARLIKNGAAYATQKGNVYYDLERSADRIGILSHQTVEGLMEGSGCRIDVEDDKRYQLDFVLWKSSPDNEPGWDSPWGRGRPGWHIECSVMSMKYCSQQLDIHGGGMDLIFPHHEAEIHQSESCTGIHPFSKYWIHNGFLTIDKEKMSKSLGNFFTIKEVLAKFPPGTIRFFIVYTHYRSTIDFSEDALVEAGRARKRLLNTISNVKHSVSEAPDNNNDCGLSELIDESRSAFIDAMDDDFNTRKAIGELFVFSRKINSIIANEKPGRPSLEKVLDLYSEINEVLGIFEDDDKANSEELSNGISDEKINELIELRDKARAEKDWAKADSIRDELKEKGIIIEDGKEGVRWRREN
ncbi:cysteinyl-tRNA synthetase [Methanolobus vulcani]|uniref:Cysteine--tRNA ligase n=1 Tax=Methanolobus vulcani TaxID=38026 RepID=A0A7Z7AW51_9EURY|nr:cysteine--tRNA ligase [Methanolobus vulcani]SDF48553.1 cysteinyl-tRNA synthetase [Methanolobus vulcani]